MGGAVRLRQDFGADELRRFAAKAKDGAQARRLLALAAVHDGMNRSKAARIGGLRPWITSEWEHDGLRVSGGAVLDRLIAMNAGEV